MIFNTRDFIARCITGRPQSAFQQDIYIHENRLKETISGKSILVIGGAGTIGSSFIKAILAFYPRKLYVIDQSENELTELTRDLRSDPNIHVPNEFKTYPLNFSSEVFYELMGSMDPFDIIANFAAHKHVRSEKDHYAVKAMLRNNVFDAYNLLGNLSQRPPAHFFCVSTDKAANPVNVMGASKKLMEELILSFAKDFSITSARFANVAFSNGSLLHGFLQRMQKGQPLSCPSDIKRYFVSPEESGHICMLSCMLGLSGDTFFPKLVEGSMKYFKDIALEFLAALELEPVICSSEIEAKQYLSSNPSTKGKYPIYFFKTETSGEKLFEEFYTEDDIVDWDAFKTLGVIKSQIQSSKSSIDRKLSALDLVLNNSDSRKADIIEVLSEILPAFKHHETGIGLDQKM